MFLDRRAIELTVTKNGYARTVRLNADALDAIRSMQRPGQRQSDRIFPRNREGTFKTNRGFTPALDDAKITARFYTCRHTCCSWLAMAGASVKEIQEAAGHKTIGMSARHAHLSPDHTQSVVDRIATTEQTATKTATGRKTESGEERRTFRK